MLLHGALTLCVERTRVRCREKEVLYNPLTGLEVCDTRVDGTTLVVEVKMSVNQKSLTLEQVTQRRKKMLQDTSAGLVVELRQQTEREGLATREAVDYFVRQLEERAAAGPLGHEAEWYNSDEQLQAALGQLLTLARGMVPGGVTRVECLAALDKATIEAYGFPAEAFTPEVVEALGQVFSR